MLKYSVRPEQSTLALALEAVGGCKGMACCNFKTVRLSLVLLMLGEGRTRTLRLADEQLP
jgi:hypothetical protein